MLHSEAKLSAIAGFAEAAPASPFAFDLVGDAGAAEPRFCSATEIDIEDAAGAGPAALALDDSAFTCSRNSAMSGSSHVLPTPPSDLRTR